MESQTRGVLGFTLLGVALVVVALLATRLQPSGVATLPDFKAATATTATGAPKLPTLPSSQGGPLRLFQQPTLSRTQIAFAFAGEIWVVPRDGGEATRLVTGQLRNERPLFSPDGSMIAYSGAYDGNLDVYVVPATGGEPRRLTYHPGPEIAVAWTPDGKNILFESWRDTPRDLPKLFTVPVTGGFPEEVPLPSGTTASYSPDGKRLAYVPYQQWEPEWKEYRGGQTTPIWIADLSDSHIVKVPRENSNDRFPMWVGNTVYFVSDRNGPYTLFAYDVGSNQVREVVHNPDGFDVRSACAGPGGIVYEQLGQISVYDTASGAAHPVPITIAADLPQLRARFETVKPPQILHAAISPTGKRVLVEAHGEILSVPADKGDTRNLTRSPGVADRDPAWSPDGKWIAWLSDETGEYALYFRSPDGVGPVKRVDLGEPPSFYYQPRWSPDSKKVALTDKRLNLWLVDVDHPTPVKVDTDRYEGAYFDPAWSPDSRWIAYVKQQKNFLHAVYVYSLEDKKTYQVTDGRSDTVSPRFDKSGKYLFFLARTDIGLAAAGGMWAMGRPVTSSVYAAVLQNDVPSPVAPESDEEGDVDAAGVPIAKDDKADKAKTAGKGDKGAAADKAGAGAAAKAAKPVRIDFDGIDQRIVALPIDRANYADLETGPAGVVFVLSAPIAFADEDYMEYDEDPAPFAVSRFDLKKRKTETFIDKMDGFDGSNGGLVTFSVSADGSKVLYASDHKWFLVDSDKPPKAGDGALKIGSLQVWIDPRAEWKQIYHEVWRIERDFLYDPHFHGLDLAAAEKLYAPFVDGVAGREDLNALFGDMLSNLVLGHVWAMGGDLPHQEHVSVGMLGADFAIDGDHYRIAHILHGENWNPKLVAPLTQPGVNVKEGDYLLAVNGQDVKTDEGPYAAFLGTAGKQTVLTVADDAHGRNTRKVTVVPVGSEGSLRLRDWMEQNRKKTDQLSGGRVGYVYIPDTFAFGLTNFNRYYFSQAGKDAVVLDERFNHGGQIADYMVDIMGWKPEMGAMTREGEDTVVPMQAIFGPKVMIANQMSGSGGDALPWLFKKAKLGPLVGVRTWGGLVGIGGYPHLVDGGRVTAPRWALYGTDGQWTVENHGIAPDIEVEMDPALVRQGHDPQLERAVQVALDELQKNPPVKLARPAYPDYGKRLPKPPGAAGENVAVH